MLFIPGNEYVCFTSETVRVHQRFTERNEGELIQLNLNPLEIGQEHTYNFSGKILTFEKITQIKCPTTFLNSENMPVDYLQKIVIYKFFDEQGDQFFISNGQMNNHFNKHFKPYFPNSSGKVILKTNLKVKTENKKVIALKSGTEVELANVIEWKLNDKNEMLKGFQLWWRNHLYTFWGTEKRFENSIIK
jgi:hypothetical protein